MTLDSDYRSLAQQVRQTARAQLDEIRMARMRRLAKPEVAQQPGQAGWDDGLAARRQRRADRLAGLERRIQDGRLEQALDAGLIELWLDPVVGDLGGIGAQAPILIGLCPRDNACAVPVDLAAASGPDTRPLGAFFGPHLPPEWQAPQDFPAVDEFFGPPRTLMAPERVKGPSETPGELAQRNLPGPSVQDADAIGIAGGPDVAASSSATSPGDRMDIPSGAGLGTVPNRPVALTLSTGMRIVKPEQDVVSGDAKVHPAFLPQMQPGEGGVMRGAQSNSVGMDASMSPQALGATVAQGSDLATLPGAGPGLIWMLQKCGIASLEDLAVADAATLVPRLGLVGRIVNVQGWQRYAQRQVGLPM